MTRIPTMYAHQRALDAMAQRRSALNGDQLQLSTGKRVNDPSDDPLAAAQAERLRSQLARISIEMMDAWVSIPFIMILLLAGLQALPREVLEAAKVDGASSWQSFWRVTFPLMAPVSITALLIRIIFKLKLADIVINVTSGGPGGATDTVSSYIYRVYRDRSTVGYGTALAMFYLILIIIFLTVLLKATSRWRRVGGKA